MSRTTKKHASSTSPASKTTWQCIEYPNYVFKAAVVPRGTNINNTAVFHVSFKRANAQTRMQMMKLRLHEIISLEPCKKNAPTATTTTRSFIVRISKIGFSENGRSCTMEAENLAVDD